MFTGIIQQLGTIQRLQDVLASNDQSQQGLARHLIIAAPASVDGVAMDSVQQQQDAWWRRLSVGDSVGCDGCCLTVTEIHAQAFGVFASAHTVANTAIQHYQQGQMVNLEQALRPMDAMGGHMVSGHVDTIIPLVELHEETGSLRMVWRVPKGYRKYITARGSVALNGVSLTVARVDDHDQDDDRDDDIGANMHVVVIPHTQQATNLATMRVGQYANMEIDLLARYVARLYQEQSLS